jgi:ornithine--oxo-acid transaminase
MADEGLVARSAELGAVLLQALRTIDHPDVVEVRGRGLLIGIELRVPARPYCEALQERGLLCKETHDTVIRLAPPLVTERGDLAWAVEQFRAVFAS